MKKIKTSCVLLLLLCLTLLLLKPVMFSVASAEFPRFDQAIQHSVKSHGSCGQSAGGQACAEARAMTAEEQISIASGYLFIIAGFLFYTLATLVSNTPISRLFRPPLFPFPRYR